MRRMPELTQLLSAKSMIFSLPAKGRLGPVIGELLEPRAAPARQHESEASLHQVLAAAEPGGCGERAVVVAGCLRCIAQGVVRNTSHFARGGFSATGFSP